MLRLFSNKPMIGHHKTKKAAVTAALEVYIRHHQQLQIFELFGQIDYDPDYDYKAERELGHLHH